MKNQYPTSAHFTILHVLHHLQLLMHPVSLTWCYFFPNIHTCQHITSYPDVPASVWDTHTTIYTCLSGLRFQDTLNAHPGET